MLQLPCWSLRLEDSTLLASKVQMSLLWLLAPFNLPPLSLVLSLCPRCSATLLADSSVAAHEMDSGCLSPSRRHWIQGASWGTCVAARALGGTRHV